MPIVTSFPRRFAARRSWRCGGDADRDNPSSPAADPLMMGSHAIKRGDNRWGRVMVMLLVPRTLKCGGYVDGIAKFKGLPSVETKCIGVVLVELIPDWLSAYQTESQSKIISNLKKPRLCDATPDSEPN